MRLIDANELSLAIDEALKTVSKEVGLSKQLMMELLAGFAHTVLNDAPTVKAIPIEWVKKYRDQFETTDDYYNVIDYMLCLWEKENEDV